MENGFLSKNTFFDLVSSDHEKLFSETLVLPEIFSGSCTTDSKLFSKQLEKCVATWKLVFIFKSCVSLAVTHDMKWPEAMCYVTGSRFKSFVCFIIEEPGVPVIDFKIGALSIAGQKI